MALTTRLTSYFGIRHPIVLAPMTPAAGGALASAVSAAGGLGLLGGGYADRSWYRRESAKVADAKVGCGFITWAIEKHLDLLDQALADHPTTMMLSFADPAPLARRIRDAKVPLICQVHTADHALRAVDCGADVIVAQGTEAGGHGMTTRATMPFVPSVADMLARRAPGVMLLAAGGIADGRGLAASLMLGADGILMGTRFWATRESLIHPTAATGDDTLRTRVYDIVRQKAWPDHYTGRLLRNDFIARWHGHEDALRTMQPAELARVEAASDTGDYDTANVTVGEAVGLINDLPSASEIVRRTVAEAQACLSRDSVG
jgi:nitronate monooxygenase